VSRKVTRLESGDYDVTIVGLGCRGCPFSESTSLFVADLIGWCNHPGVHEDHPRGRPITSADDLPPKWCLMADGACVIRMVWRKK